MKDCIAGFRSFAELRIAVETGALRVPHMATVNLYLDLAEDLLGVEFHTGHHVESMDAFERRFPSDFNPAIFPKFDDAVLYRKWRKCIVELMRLAGHTDGIDPVAHLNMFARRDGIIAINKAAYQRAFANLSPYRIGREVAIKADLPLRELERQTLRKVLATLDRIRDIEEVQALGLLGPEQIGMLPQYLDGDKVRRPLPSQLDHLAKTLAPAKRRLVARVYNIGVDAGIFSPGHDLSGIAMLEGDKQVALHRAIESVTSKGTAKIYINTLKRIVGCSDKGVISSSAKRRKADLAKAPREPKPNPHRLPEFIEQAITDFRYATNARSAQVKELRSVFRRLLASRHAENMEALLEDAETRLLSLSSNVSVTMKPIYRRALRAYLKHVGQQCPWSAVLEARRKDGMPRSSQRGLSTVRRFAKKLDPTLMPAGITSSVAGELVALAKTCGQKHEIPRLWNGFADLDALRPFLPDMLPPEMIGDKYNGSRERAVLLPAELQSQIREHARFSGLTAASERALMVALRKLSSLIPIGDELALPLAQIPFAKLVEDASRRDPEGMRPYRDELLRLEERLRIVWTQGWRNLQNAVVVAGVSRADNPIEAMLRVAGPDGREPWQLDREWAFCYERGLRPDLRLTWSRNVDRFDALHALLDPTERKLLPTERLGPMPPRGSRLKNAVYPLPNSVDVALTGETKQVLEAAHFVWRCARDLGLWQRGEAPDTTALFCNEVLDRVDQHQKLITKAAARLHLARIADWKRGRLDRSEPVVPRSQLDR